MDCVHKNIFVCRRDHRLLTGRPKKRRKQKTNLENNNNNAKLRFSKRENVLRKNVLLTKLNTSYFREDCFSFLINFSL
jgi:hypothetical protein